MADLASGNKLTTNEEFNLPVIPGRRYALGIAGTDFGGGSLGIRWIDRENNYVEFDDSPLTTFGGFEFVCPSETLQLALTGSVDANLIVYLALIS